MRKIPTRLREEMDAMPFYHLCCFHRVNHGPTVKIEWHHNLIYAGTQVNEKWCILPICEAIHEKANEKHIRERLDWIMVNRATEAELKKFSKVRNLIFQKGQLNQQYGKYIPI